MTVFALLGSTALWLLYAWLISAIVASYLSGRKGYGERAGLACGLLLNSIGVIDLADHPRPSRSRCGRRSARGAAVARTETPPPDTTPGRRRARRRRRP